MLEVWIPYGFVPSQRSLLTVSGSSLRLMVLLAQGPSVVEVTWRLLSMLFTPTGAPPSHHCTEGVGIPWKEQLQCSVFSKEQEELSSLAGAVEGGGSAKRPGFPSLLPGPSSSLGCYVQGVSERLSGISEWGWDSGSPSSFLLICPTLRLCSDL